MKFTTIPLSTVKHVEQIYFRSQLTQNILFLICNKVFSCWHWFPIEGLTIIFYVPLCRDLNPDNKHKHAFLLLLMTFKHLHKMYMFVSRRWNYGIEYDLVPGLYEQHSIFTMVTYFLRWTLLKFFSSFPDEQSQQKDRQLDRITAQWLIHQMKLRARYCGNFEFIIFLWEF